MTAAEARALAEPYAEKIRALVDSAPPVPSDALALLAATGFRPRPVDLEAAS